MKLIQTRSYQLTEFTDLNLPPFAVLSHASTLFPCGVPKLSLQSTPIHLSPTITQACHEANSRGLDFLWIGSVCVDKTSSLELQHAVSASFRLLQAATVCFVYLKELSPSSVLLEECWRHCRYWTRSWTLQELVAPPNVEFFDADWNYRGAKSSPYLLDILQNITRIDKEILSDIKAFSRVAIGVRLSWAAGREATRTEDAVYSLVGIAGINISIRYGEGLTQAFARLVNKIIRNNMDGSIFAWTSNDDQFARGLLPRSVDEFRHLSGTDEFPLFQQPWTFDGNVQFHRNGLLLDTLTSSRDSSLILEICSTSEKRLGIRIQMWENNFVRVSSRELVQGFKDTKHCRILAARDIDAETSQSISNLSKKRKRSGQLMANISECSASPLGSTHTSSSCLLHEDACSPCSYPEDVLGLEVPNVGDEKGEDEDADDGDREWQTHTIEVHERTSLVPNHEFRTERNGLLRHFSQRVRKWAASTNYTTPRGSRLPRKRIKIMDSESHYTSEESDFEDIEDVPNDISIIPPVDGYFHLACPFYAINPVKYQQCLLNDDLRSIEGVVEHTRKHHWKPPYCPRCRIILETTMARDNHIREQVCEVRNPSRIEGIDGNQLKRIMDVTTWELGEAETWAGIFAVACPDAPACASPYLIDDLGLQVSKIRDYWNRKGREYIEEYVSGKGFLSLDRDEFGALEVFHSLTLADLV
ncbi:hypothetical protein BDP55DRAFT_668141 [Colletotrichum godetiae]|uniref:HET domain-containing protein n=1 Tax=Colletotrichum godetiae TaxID=1209918 RepID=A0AAJ0AJ63_9PEZI|nr:uncharacterized protein BDP55DRAFT_668141 [Colletotrichum godetiae]KAK1674210.1 hypothetical protein BDP55DRAFT_668141 [Colletotrichum godetiae]